MSVRTTTKTVTFTRSFVINGLDEEQPPGDYEVETDEELLESLSFPAYRRLLTMIRLPPRPTHPGMTRSVAIDPQELETALKQDAASDNEYPKKGSPPC
jgi:hypothetical protein